MTETVVCPACGTSRVTGCLIVGNTIPPRPNCAFPSHMRGAQHGRVQRAGDYVIRCAWAVDARALLERAHAAQADRAARMPDEKAALRALTDAVQRLKELGWGDADYCPKDGSSFDVIEAGSSGVHRCHYSGEWPNGSWWIEEADDLWPSRPTLFRLDPEAAEAERKRMLEVAARFAAQRATATRSEKDRG